MCFVGLKFGKAAIDWLRRDDPQGQHLRISGVCDLDATLAAKIGAELGVPHYTDLATVLKDPAHQTIGLFTPPAGRAALLRQIIAAGRDVMTTKPFELDAVAGAAALSAAKAAGRVIHLNSPSPAPHDISRIQQWAQHHQLGRLVAARAEVVVGYGEQADGSWYDDPMRCPLAPVFRIGIYVINDLVRLCGPASEVYAQGVRIRTGRPTPDQGQLSIRFANGALGSVLASFCCTDGDHYRNSLVLHYELGTITRNLDPALAWTQGVPLGADLALVRGDGKKRGPIERTSVPQMSGEYQWQLFAEAVHARRPLADDVADAAVNAVKVVQAMAESERTGMPVQIA